ncbi:MAG: peptide deformylase [Lachnospiraceae bacterium]|nr:peptide deformylase [Lachnospiraceae bacterium]
MSTRIVRETGDEILSKKSKDVVELNDRLKELILDMKETMTTSKGCGLAAVQVGVLRNIIVVQPDEEKEIYTFINPKITWLSPEKEKSIEGCLSVKGKKGIVERSKKIKFVAKDENMQDHEYEASDFMARIVQHEVDHLEGHLYTEKIDGRLYDTEEKVPGYEDDDDESEK